MATKLEMTIEGEKQVSRRLRKIGNKVKDFSPELRESAKFLTKFFRIDVFRTKGAILGERWEPLAPSTIEEKRRLGYPLFPLIRTRKMKKGFKKKVRKQEAEIYNVMDYFKYHQSRLPRRHLPRRVMMKMTQKMKGKIIQIIHKGLWKRING